MNRPSVCMGGWSITTCVDLPFPHNKLVCEPKVALCWSVQGTHKCSLCTQAFLYIRLCYRPPPSPHVWGYCAPSQGDGGCLWLAGWSSISLLVFCVLRMCSLVWLCVHVRYHVHMCATVCSVCVWVSLINLLQLLPLQFHENSDAEVEFVHDEGHVLLLRPSLLQWGRGHNLPHHPWGAGGGGKD